MENLTSLFSDYTFQIVATGSALLGIISGVLGSFAVLRKQSLLGDGVSHASLPGVVIAFLLIGSKNIEVLLLGAFCSAILANLLIITITKYSKIKFDSALAIILSVFFGLGLVCLTISQKIPNANQAGLESFIYGQASAMLLRDLKIIVLCGITLLIIVALFWKEFKLLAFDPEFTQTIGFNSQKLNLLLNFLIVVAIIIGLQTVGVILMSAMLIAPAVAARQWVQQLGKMIMLSAIFGGFSGVVGTAISSSISNMPTGPVIVICASFIAFFSLLFAPRRGVIYEIYRRFKNKQNFSKERKIK